jgi:hypothetical protein
MTRRVVLVRVNVSRGNVDRHSVLGWIQTSNDAGAEIVWIHRRRRAEENATFEVGKRPSCVFEKQRGSNNAPLGESHDAIKRTQALHGLDETGDQVLVLAHVGKLGEISIQAAEEVFVGCRCTCLK